MKKSVLISVYNKDGIDRLAKKLVERFGYQIISTGGSAEFLRNAGLQVTDVSQITGFDEMLNGRVKTLHPMIHAGLLAQRDNDEHLATMADYQIPDIRIVCVNLYPFADKVKQAASQADTIEHIDVGGVAMIRAAAKNYHSITVVTRPQQYDTLMQALDEGDGITSYEFRKNMASSAFAHTALYDALIANYFASDANKDNKSNMPPLLLLGGENKMQLRYGENPHQQAALYGSDEESVFGARLITGKKPSYNNIKDMQSAIILAEQLHDNRQSHASCVVVKHATPCGCACSEYDIATACEKAIAADRISAFGGIIACSRPIDERAARQLSQIFIEILIAPRFSQKALEVLQSKSGLRIFEYDFDANPGFRADYEASLLDKNTVIAQTSLDSKITIDDIKQVSTTAAGEQQIEDMIFANIVASQVRSNAIVIARNSQTLGICGGQTSRVDAVRIAAEKSRLNLKESNQNNADDDKNLVLSSDAFFPFADSIELMADYDIRAVIQPGGSIRDAEVIEAANRHNIAMYFTGKRIFKH